MSATWYYVLNGERQGPVEKGEVEALIRSGQLTGNDYVWTKGLPNWIRLKEAPDFNFSGGGNPPSMKELDLSQLAPTEKCLYIKIGMDRGMANEVEYGPFSLNILKKLFDEKRVNHKTFVFASGMQDWLPLGTLNGFETVFETSEGLESNIDRRDSKRKPLVARMFIKNKNEVFEGICRDISIGGMQVLVDSFPGKPGDNVDINVHPENTDYHFVASGSIVRLLEGGQGFSFRFINLEKDAIKAIEKYLTQSK